MSRRSGGRRARPLASRLTPLVALVAALCAPRAGVADAVLARASIPPVRVLLYEGPGPIELAGPDGRQRVSAARGAALRVDGAARGRLRLAADPTPVAVRFGTAPEVGRRSGHGADVRVRGALEVTRTEAGLRVVNEIALEDYLVGTVGREMSPQWEPEALRAQAVASRTYALHQREARRGEPWHLRSDARSQVYGGVDAETTSVREAALHTRGEVLTWQGRPILAAFHSASGGITASAEEVWGEPVAYLTSRPVPGEDDSPDTYWRARVPARELSRALERIGRPVGAPQRVEIRERSASGRVRRVDVRGARGVARLDGRALRGALGESFLRSTLFHVRRESDGAFVFYGSGHGHGVGMSQWGARAMAARGAEYGEILEAFFPGTRLETWSDAARVALDGGTR